MFSNHSSAGIAFLKEINDIKNVQLVGHVSTHTQKTIPGKLENGRKRKRNVYFKGLL